MNNYDTLVKFLHISKHRMIEHYLPKLIHSVNALDKEILWMQEIGNANTIGGIALHIGEQLNRHIQRIKSPDIMFASGIEHYFPELDVEPAALAKKLEELFLEWNGMISNRLAKCEFQDLDSTFDMHSIYHLVEHTGYHLGQIVDRTQRITNESFQFCQNGLNERNLKSGIEKAIIIEQ